MTLSVSSSHCHRRLTSARSLETTLTADEEKPARRKSISKQPSSKQTRAKQPMTTQKVQRVATGPQAYRRNATNRADEQ